jgi:hypothetical protein
VTDRGVLSRVRMSENKVRRKDLCGSVKVIYVLEKLQDVSGPSLVEAGRYKCLCLVPDACTDKLSGSSGLADEGQPLGG